MPNVPFKRNRPKAVNVVIFCEVNLVAEPVREPVLHFGVEKPETIFGDPTDWEYFLELVDGTASEETRGE